LSQENWSSRSMVNKHGDLCMCVDCLGGGFEEEECPCCGNQLSEGCCLECGECYG